MAPHIGPRSFLFEVCHRRSNQQNIRCFRRVINAINRFYKLLSFFKTDIGGFYKKKIRAVYTLTHVQKAMHVVK